MKNDFLFLYDIFLISIIFLIIFIKCLNNLYHKIKFLILFLNNNMIFIFYIKLNIINNRK